MYEEYLGDDYHKKIRKILRVGKDICPDSVIDADFNIGAMKSLSADVIEKMQINGSNFTDESYDQFREMCIYFLAGILCIPMYSRSSNPTWKKPKYQKDWKKIQRDCNGKAHEIIKVLMQMG